MPSQPPPRFRRTLPSINLLVILNLLGAPGTVHAQIVADAAAPAHQQPQIVSSASGIPQVNIQTPNAAGVSINRYSQFDVSAGGVILNNGHTHSLTQLGGWIQANANLGAGCAQLILNEVHSSSPSQLHGFVEVAGQRADVVIANPAGISVNGGGFLNARGVTLATARPVFHPGDSAQGGTLQGYRVQDGQVSIWGAGLDTRSADYTHILARAVQLNAGLWAQRLQVITGRNAIAAKSPDQLSVTSSAAATSAPEAQAPPPAFALDVALLGGMYAGQIFLIGTEAGLGVRNGGTIGASAGDLVLSADGWLSNTGSLQAAQRLHISVQEFDNAAAGVLRAANTTLEVHNTLNNRGLIDSQGESQATDEGATTQASDSGQTRIRATTLNNTGSGILLGDQVSIAARTLNNTAESVHGGVRGATVGARVRLDIGVHTLNNSDAGLDTPGGPSHTATPSTQLLSLGALHIGGALDAQGHAQGSATAVNNHSASIEAAGHLRLQATELNNTDAHFAWTTATTTTSPQLRLEDSPTHYVQVTRQSVTAPVVTAALPARIQAGGDMTLQVQSVINANSQILAGGALTVANAVQVNNAGVLATQTTTQSGTQHTQFEDHSCQTMVFDKCIAWGPWYSYWRASDYASTTQQTVRVGAGTATSNTSNSSNSLNTPSAAPGIRLPASSLYTLQPSATAGYLVNTHPAFTQREHWLSSSFMSHQVALEPSVTQKRLGDGFYEQQRINAQLIERTGRGLGRAGTGALFQTDDRTDAQQAYQQLMSAGVTYAQAYQLQLGIALSAAQMARLTSDIVWLQQETITLADGTTTTALVPQLYLRPTTIHLDPGGALMSGSTVHISTSGDTLNSATLLGDQRVQISAANVRNQGGDISATAVRLDAAQDIDNTAGRVRAQDSLELNAGRDIRSVSTTATAHARSASGSSTVSNTTLDRQAGLYVEGGGASTLRASAAGDLLLVGSTVRNSGAGATTLLAGRNLLLDAALLGQSSAVDFDAATYYHSSHSEEVGSRIEAGGDLSLQAGAHILSRGAQIQAGGAVNLLAQQSIALDAGQSTSQADHAQTVTSTGLVSSERSSRTQSSSATAQVTSIQGQSVYIVAQEQLLSIGATLNGTQGVYAEGKGGANFYAVHNTQQSSTTTQTRSSLLGTELEHSELTQSHLQSSAIGSTLISTQKVEISIGDTAELQGAHIEAPQIRFLQTGADRAGELMLGASIDTVQTSHTEARETAGVWQEQKGHGETTQTLNQTTLKGNVTFDSGLKITAQVADNLAGLNPDPVPATQAATALKSQLQALASQASGLDYLQQLANTPGVQWEQVALANEHWNYEQAGLTPAGAALLTIAVAAYMPGASGFLGTTAPVAGAAGAAGATATTLGGMTLATTTAASATAAGLTTYTAAGAALNAGFATLAAQTSVAMLNNGGDIGKTLEQLGRDESVKNLLTTMVTAGAIQGLNQTLFADGADGAGGAGGAASNNSANHATAIGTPSSAFAQNLVRNVSNNVAGAAISSAIHGAPLDESALSTALSSALVSTAMADAANAIGDAATPTNGTPAQIDAFTQQVAHAVLGCAGGAAMAGAGGGGSGGGCSAGAVGAVVGELSAGFAKAQQLSDADALALAQVVSATAGLLVGGGGDNAEAVNTAASTGGNAAENNYLKHAERTALNEAQKACFADAGSSACATASALQRKDQLSDQWLSNAAGACQGADCNDVTNFIQTQLSSQGCTAPHACPDYNTLSNYLRVAQEKAQGLEAVYPEGWVLDAKAVLDLGKFGVKVLSGAGGEAKGSLDALAQLAKTDAAKITNNFYRDGDTLPQSLSTSSGRVIQATDGKTTTILGTWREDTNAIINTQVGLPKSLNYLDPKPGAFNLLNTPTEVYNSLGAEQFWMEINKPFLEAAMKRGDEIYLATNPTPSILSRQGSFAREYNLLREHGYTFQPSTGKMVKIK